MNEKEFYTAAELVQRWNGRVTTRTLANWRSSGTSPPFVKLGGRILYRVEDIHEWERGRTVNSTQQYRR